MTTCLYFNLAFTDKLTHLDRKHPPIKLGAPGEEIGKKDLNQVIKRFKSLHHLKLKNTQACLLPRQRVFLDILALVFHQNHPALPGYIDPETPCGLLDFKPGPTALQSCRQHFKNFHYQRKALPQYAIEGIYLMGSVGSMAFSQTSDLDIWLCHDETLTPDQLSLLQKKATAIERWAESLALEVHFFLMNARQFRQGQHSAISTESSGDTQHFLLLEEFYRTAIYIAGKAPAWWLVPPEQDQHYTEYIDHLLTNRFISGQEIIDFGGLQSVPPDEFISATLWHIYKSLSSPYKSLLKLFLMEAYASEYPNIDWLASQLKRAVYQGDLELEKLDPYFLVYQKVEQYLGLVASRRRLALARACFYLKIMGNTDKPVASLDRKKRLAYLQSIATHWRWPEGMLEQLSQKQTWNVYKAVSEDKVIRDQLRHCLQMISRFAQQHHPADYAHNQDMKLINRKLHSFLVRRHGKINVLTTRHSIYRQMTAGTLLETTTHPPQWQLFAEHHRDVSQTSQPINRGENLIDLFCWLIVNRLFHPQLSLHLESHQTNLPSIDSHTLLYKLHHFLAPFLTQGNDLSIYSQANHSHAILLFINLLDEIEPVENDGKLLISDRTDPLSYGSRRTHFIRTTTRITVTRWGEICTSRHHQPEGLFDCLLDFYNNSSASTRLENIQVMCFSSLRGRSIQNRVEQIINRLHQFHHQADDWRYFLPIGPHYYHLYRHEGILQIRYLENETALLEQLKVYQNTYLSTFFDPFVLDDTVIPLLYQHSLANTVNVFYEQQENTTDIYVIDERATLFQCQYQDSQPTHIVHHLQVFLSGLIDEAKLPDSLEIQFFELQKNSAGIISCQPLPPQPSLYFPELSIRVSASDEPTSLCIDCNGETFSEQNHADIYDQARQYILSFRKNQAAYPCFITAIDVPCHLLGAPTNKHLQTTHYLNYKHTIEQLLSFQNDSTSA